MPEGVCEKVENLIDVVPAEALQHRPRRSGVFGETRMERLRTLTTYVEVGGEARWARVVVSDNCAKQESSRSLLIL